MQKKGENKIMLLQEALGNCAEVAHKGEERTSVIVKVHPGKHLKKDELTLQPDMPPLNPPSPNGMRWRTTQSKSRISSRPQPRSTQALQKCTRCPASCGVRAVTVGSVPLEVSWTYPRTRAPTLEPTGCRRSLDITIQPLWFLKYAVRHIPI